MRGWWITIAAGVLLAGCFPVGTAQDAGDAPGDTVDTTAPPPPHRLEGPEWYREAVFYHIWVRSFRDSDGDGIGDLRGVTERLEHVASLGVDAIWLSPYYPTPYFDSGYDVADFTAIDPEYGTLADWDALLEEAHARGIRVWGDLVLNHTSIDHPWFQASRSAPGDPRRDWYIWADAPAFQCPPIDAAVFGTDPWTQDPATGAYYFHRFYPQQPDLNYRNPAVAEAMQDVARFWLDRGVDGFRVDAITTLVEDPPGTPANEFRCDDHPGTHDFLKTLRGVLDAYEGRAMLAEAWASPGATAAYFGDGSDEFHMSVSRELVVAMQAAFLYDNPGALAAAVAAAGAPLPPGAQWGLFLSNHDQPRIMASVGNSADRAAMAAVLLLTLPGTPFIYYGDEVGVTNGAGVVVDLRDRSRTPMPWSDAPGLGFTDGEAFWLDPAPGWETANVAAQDGDPASLLSLYRGLVAVRRDAGVFGAGAFVPLDTPEHGGRLLVFRRGTPAAGALVLVHFGDSVLPGGLDLSSLLGGVAADPALASFDAPGIGGDGLLQAEVPPFAFAIWTRPHPPTK
jgi:alpha-glucosidase